MSGRKAAASLQPVARLISVDFGGQEVNIAQGNNAFIFPGLGLGLMVGEIKRVTPTILAAAARALADTVTEEERQGGMLFPRIARMPEAANAVAIAVVEAAGTEGVRPVPFLR